MSNENEGTDGKSATGLDSFLQKVQENSLGANYIAVIKKYKVYEGRASVREFWLFVLAQIIIGLALGILTRIPILGYLFWLISSLFGIATIIPSIMVGIRRLHDRDKRGWFLLLMLIPLVGGIILLVFCAMEGTPGENKYGPVPEDALPISGVLNSGSQPGHTAHAASSASVEGKPVFCGSCGAKNERGAKFCGSCGEKMA
ncbi:MAG: DUF805 domain-containing protein [Treponema sp.]|jgi:uncharacterized membrane protein YhaH (DUF805 family)|nr:DUF805 domain-containing protein [Treponema sp.]